MSVPSALAERGCVFVPSGPEPRFFQIHFTLELARFVIAHATRRRAEFIVVDDQSADRTSEILRRLVKSLRVQVKRVDVSPDGWLGKCPAVTAWGRSPPSNDRAFQSSARAMVRRIHSRRATVFRGFLLKSACIVTMFWAHEPFSPGCRSLVPWCATAPRNIS